MVKVRIDRTDFEMAFEQFAEGEITAFLDTTDGKVIWFEDRVRHDLDDLLTNEETLEKVETMLQSQTDLQDWERTQLLEAARIEWDEAERYRVIPYQDSRVGYEDMQEYIWALEDEHLRELLEVAIHGSGAFGRFKDVIHRDPKVRDDWDKFREARVTERMMDWFRREGLEVEFH